MSSSIESTWSLQGRNALPSLIASDILTSVFSDLKSCCENDEYRWRRCPYSWIRVTHVCRHWRTNALSSPLLWSHIIVRRSDWTQECLTRSGQAPIDVSLLRGAVPTEDAVTSLSLILRHYPRVRSLRLEIPKDSYVAFAKLGEIDLESPLLQLLSLQMTDEGPSDGSDVLSLFVNGNRALPMLAAVELDGLASPWKVACLPKSLRRLSITQTHYQSDYHDMLDALEGFPLLETLEIYHAVPQMPVSEYTTRKPIFLHHLGCLKMACNASDCGRLLTVLRFPKSAMLELECDLDDRHTNLPAFVQSVARHLDNGANDNSTHLLSVSLRCDEFDPWRLLLFRGWWTIRPLSVLEDEFAETQSDVTLKLTLSEWMRDREGSAIRYLLPRLPLTKVLAISIENVHTKQPEQTLAQIFSQMDDLRSLSFSCNPGLVEL